jgi:hypothetical protein
MYLTGRKSRLRGTPEMKGNERKADGMVKSS